MKVYDLQGFMFIEVIKIVEFCNHFYTSIRGFTQKILFLTLGYFEEVDLVK